MALTVAEVRSHVGAMLQYGFTNDALRAQGGLTFREFVLWARAYRNNGTLGTREQRREAMMRFLKFVFEQVTGLNPASYAHEFRYHWVNEIAPGDAAEMDEVP